MLLHYAAQSCCFVSKFIEDFVIQKFFSNYVKKQCYGSTCDPQSKKQNTAHRVLHENLTFLMETKMVNTGGFFFFIDYYIVLEFEGYYHALKKKKKKGNKRKTS